MKIKFLKTKKVYSVVGYKNNTKAHIYQGVQKMELRNNFIYNSTKE